MIKIDYLDTFRMQFWRTPHKAFVGTSYPVHYNGYMHVPISRAAPIPLLTDTSNAKYSAAKYLQVQVP